MRFGTGVVIGKFLPPHRGHRLLIETAIGASEQVTVIVCGKPSDPIPAELRGVWLQEIHPTARVMVIDDRYDENDSQVWAENTMQWLGRAPDAVFTSESYGDRYAGFMGSVHVNVDQRRERVPISGTAVRSDPYANWEYLEPPVRGWFAKRVCVLGAESTGTTTLACDLARAFQTEWVEEYGREYSVTKMASGEAWRTDEFPVIAREQTRREDAAARRANRVLICDTNAFATALWHRRYVGGTNSELDSIAQQVRCDLYLLTGDEIPFVQDGLRDGEHIRHQMHGWFVEALDRQSVPWRLVQGSQAERLRQGRIQISSLFTDSSWMPGAAFPGTAWRL
ncbi:AAA family ATPase [Opitutus terrae]|uniref:Putative transcriptional regulatory protein NadR (Probably AsnC-family) n=1 Tax=Opitutus terrae (strain DSM 11246 / JCM 15787 / PB90-1) TaxID=452637 RepID=B1ZNT7_OPITP|nr:AAA family ATPase [Opitutus terrae]ACB75457.1 putative transcriptional regulatory protein NadR (probably AsnC-family) [Opitutus terrae PB90-1]